MSGEKDSREEDDWNKLFAQDATGTGGLNLAIPTDLSGVDAIKHLDDATNFEDEDELADEIEPLGEEQGEAQDIDEDGDVNFDDFFGADHSDGESQEETVKKEEVLKEENEKEKEETEEKEAKQEKQEKQEKILDKQIEGKEGAPDLTMEEENLLKKFFPDFVKGSVLKMNSLFGPKPSKISYARPRPARTCVPTRVRLEISTDQRNLFLSPALRPPKDSGNIVHVKWKKDIGYSNWKAGRSSGDSNELDKDLLLASANWDTVYDSDKEEDIPKRSTDWPKLTIHESHDVYDSDLEESILDGSNDLTHFKVSLDINDTNLVFAEDKVPKQQDRDITLPPATESQLMRRFNISNDRAYDMLKENYQSKVRSTIGNLNIDHSMVARRLQSPHYKVRLSKAQMRSFHRPSFIVKPNTTITFSKIKQRKKKRDKGKHITELLNKTTDLTLGDSALFFLMEYSEEFPLALSNFGMGSKLINYYRKKSADDTSRPKLPVGETHVLGLQDKSAFWNFGFVENGNVVPTLYNRMIRAPVFKHEVKSTDFLLVRTTGGGLGQRYYIRAIPHLFTVGQTFPVTQIPGPHSRKVTTVSKNRLKMVVYRVLHKNPSHRIQVRDISTHFPDQNDMQNRQRLKEFMEFQRAGDDQGYWKVKATDPLPDKETIRNMITPEDVSLLESMQVGQQHLEDSGYGKTVEDDQDDEDGMSIEEQLAPWNVSRNFINATQGKAMLQLHGEGDPSGRGEAFSLIRTSMKGGFRAMGESVNDKIDKSKFGGHSYNVAMQQKAYDDEISRIWYAQKRSLSITNPEDLGWEEEAEANRRESYVGQGVENTNQDRDDDEMSLFSHTSGTVRQNKVLRITRFTKDENGTVQRKVEIVKDSNVIRAYVKRRQIIEESQLLPDDIAPTNDEEGNKRRRKILEDHLARLQRNQDRRNARKAGKDGQSPGTPTSGKITKGKPTTRKCATCGAIGHIKTNKSCPMYHLRNDDSQSQTSESLAS